MAQSNILPATLSLETLLALWEPAYRLRRPLQNYARHGAV
jgi:hypothetical protein